MSDIERSRRWRLILGQEPDSAENESQAPSDAPADAPPDDNPLSDRDQRIDDTLSTVYGDGDEGGLGDAAPEIVRWLEDIRSYFPAPVAQIMQRDAFNKLPLRKLLQDPNLLDQITPDVALATRLLALNKSIPPKARANARRIVRQVVDELREKLTYPLQQALSGTLDRAARNRRPRHAEINWLRTIHANLKHYQPDYQTIVPETLVGFGRRRNALRDVILCIDQSGSMAKSFFYAAVFGAVLASIPALATQLVAFSTTVVDLTDQLDDPVELLFGTQLRGGTDISRALGYCRQLVTRPRDTILVLISDLYEGGDKAQLITHVSELLADGVQVIVLLALNDEGTPRFDRAIAQQMVELGVPSFACTPDLFPELMAAAINRRDMGQWAASHDIVTAPSN